jgi:hypothetical protein
MLSKYQLQPYPENSGCIDIFPDRNDPGRIDKLFLSRPKDLYVRCQLHPRCYGKIVVCLEPILIPQKGPVQNRTRELRVTDM